MDKVIIELDENQEFDKQPNVGMVKQEAAEVDDIPLQHEKPENVSTNQQFASTSLSTFDEIGYRSLEQNSEMVAQNSDEELSLKEELLHEELDIKSDNEATQETCVDEEHDLGSKLHRYRKHVCGVRRFKCNTCDYRCGQKSAFKRHLITHTGKKPFKCNICESSFAQNGNLTRHLRTHIGEKTFKCDICDYSSGEKYYLKAHLRTHTGEKPFKCTICDYRFGYKCVLKNHLRIHTGEKLFKCNICGHSFAQKDYLKKHLRTHTGEKPFKCDICDYSCRQKGNLKRHLGTHTREQQF